MTPDELYAKGYAVEYSTWGAIVFFDTPDHMETLARLVVHSDKPLTDAEAQALGWRAAEVDYVKRRLDGDTSNTNPDTLYRQADQREIRD